MMMIGGTIAKRIGRISAAILAGIIAPNIQAQNPVDWTASPNLNGPQPYFLVKPLTGDAQDAMKSMARPAAQSSLPSLPFWSYNLVASRDNNSYSGIMVGTDPFHAPGTSKVPTYIVPIILITNSVGVGYDPTTGAITTAPGVTKFDPTEKMLQTGRFDAQVQVRSSV